MPKMKRLRAALALSCLGLAAVAGSVLVASLATAAEERMSKEECTNELEDYISKLEQPPEEEVVDEAKARCNDGDLKGAKGVIQEAGETIEQKCQKEVDAYVARYNIKPNARNKADAKAYCKKGDARSAVRVIGRP